MKELSPRALGIPQSAPMVVDIRAKELIAEGRDIINLSAGEPDFPTPEEVREAGKAAIDAGKTKYTPAFGGDRLISVIAEKYRVTKKSVAVMGGAKHSVFIAAMTLFSEGDEVLLPAPYWISYYRIIALTGAKPVIIPTKSPFRLTVSELEKRINGKTKGIIFNNPVNPTGVLYSEEELRAFAEVCKKHDLYIISDEIYSSIVYDGAIFHSMREFAPERTVVVDGVSKSYAMTGWRIGYTVAPENITAAIRAILSHSTGCPCTVSQLAAAKALTLSVSPEMLREYTERRDIITSLLGSAVPVKPQGAFYAMIKNNGFSAMEILERCGVALVDGEPFGAPGFLRLSYTLPSERIREGCVRLRECMSLS